MKRTLASAATVAAVTAVVGVGASVLVLGASDGAPGSGKAEAACAGPLAIANPVTKIGHDLDAVVEVSITGDLTECAGQTMLVEVDLDDTGVEHAYAVYLVPLATTSVVLDFDATTGAFYDTAPTAAGGTLLPEGDRMAPVRARDFGLVTVTIASRWS